MYLFDTNALSEPVKRRPSAAFVRRLAAVREQRLCTSSICLMELRYGCARVSQGMSLWRRLQEHVLGRVTVLPVDEAVAERAGDLLAALHRVGRPRSMEDLLIAATSLVHGLILVTHNRRDFADIPGVRVEDWM